ncbi:MAG: LacI family transcriptional regulator [Acholeplasmataceae bacterium]|nr:LacI family transcriptional regulator [Acholeplasmataceae bacterium]
MTTIKDIAKACGVSASTVSYALSERGTIAEKTKNKIKETAKAMNYVPNAHARGLKKKRSHKIAVFVPGFQGTVHPTILAGIANVMRTNQVLYNLLVTFCDEDMTIVKDGSVDLAIVMDSNVTKQMIHDIASHVPTILFDQSAEGDNVYNTTVQNEEAMALMTTLMINKGLKRIGFLLGSSTSTHNTLRFLGYKRALRDHGLVFDPSLVYDADAFTEFKGHEAMDLALAKAEDLPFEGLVCCNDELAFGALGALGEHGFKVPEDCLVSGFDNIARAETSIPSLTTVMIDWYDYGQRMAKLALDLLSEKPDATSFVVDFKIIERKSTSRSSHS